MKFSNVVLGLAAAEGILAAKWSDKRRESRNARRNQDPQLSTRGAKGSLRQSQPMIKATESGEAHVEYSTNWAGAVLIGTGYTGVTGVVVAPTLSTSQSSKSELAGTAWVGIDGDTCGTAILQTGIDWYIENGKVSYDAWYEWYPDYSYDFSGITISEGDSIKMTVKATSKTSGTATIENETTGVTVSQTFTGVTDGSLCEYNAEWIVEDFEECTGSSESSCSLVPFADFGTVEFTSCSATKSGSTVGVTGATILDIKQSGTVLTSCSDTSDTVTCTYV